MFWEQAAWAMAPPPTGGGEGPPQLNFFYILIPLLLIFWIFLIPFFTAVDYSTGFIVFTVIIGIRLVLNLYTNNVLDLKPEEYEAFPFRIP